MNVGNLLLYTSLLFVCLAAIFMLRGKTKLGILFTRIATASLTLSVLLLAYAFVFLDFSLFYVWRNNSAELPIFYRLAAILVGQEGTYFVWAWLSLIVVLLHIEIRGISGQAALFTNAYALLGCAFLLVLTITMTPFMSIFNIEGASLPTFGNSLNPALVDILMPLHIFFVFAAYAFAIIPAAASLAYLTLMNPGGTVFFRPDTQTKLEMPRIKNYLRLSWLFLSIGMVTGGMWANEMLGWSGLWQWDPVQSTTMASWLLLTAAMHVGVRFNRGEYTRLYPLLCIGTFLGFFYITLVARSGVYSSIHSFPETPTWWMLVVFISVIIILSLILALKIKVQEDAKPGRIYSAFEPYNTFYYTVLILLIMVFIALWGPTLYIILFYIGHTTIVSPEYYNIFLYPMVMGLSYLTGICMLYGRIKDKMLAYASVIYFASSIILVPYGAYSVAMPTAYTDSFLERILGFISITSYLPAFFFVTGSVIFKTLREYKLKNRVIALHLTGVNLIHIGFVFVVMGAIISTSFATTHNFIYNLDEKGVYKENNGIGIRLLDFRVEQVGTDWLQIVDVEVTYGGKYNMTTVYEKSLQYGFIVYPAVRYGLLSDIHVDFQGSVPHEVQRQKIELNVKKQPLASVLWTGCILFIVGILLTLGSDVVLRKK